MADLTPDNLRAFVLVLLGIAAVIVSIDKGIEAWHHLFGTKDRADKEKAVNDRIKGVEDRVKACEDRLKRGDEKFDSFSEDLTMVLNVLNTLLLHMYSGNDHEKLKDMLTSMNTYMSKRR